MKFNYTKWEFSHCIFLISAAFFFFILQSPVESVYDSQEKPANKSLLWIQHIVFAWSGRNNAPKIQPITKQQIQVVYYRRRIEKWKKSQNLLVEWCNLESCICKWKVSPTVSCLSAKNRWKIMGHDRHTKWGPIRSFNIHRNVIK